MGTLMICAVMMVKNEADIILSTVDHLLGQVDWIIVMDNDSTDGTREMLEGVEGIERMYDPDPAYRQSEKMSWLAARAADRGATWVVPADADEIWSHPEMCIADFLGKIPSDRAIVTARLYDYVATGADDASESDPVRRLQWRRRHSAKLRKVAVRPTLPVTIEQGNHGAHYCHPDATDGLIVRHYPYRSAQQMTAKAMIGDAALQAAPELLETSGAHWRQYAALERANPGAVAEVFEQWFYVEDPGVDATLVHDPWR